MLRMQHAQWIVIMMVTIAARDALSHVTRISPYGDIPAQPLPPPRHHRAWQQATPSMATGTARLATGS